MSGGGVRRQGALERDALLTLIVQLLPRTSGQEVSRCVGVIHAFTTQIQSLC